MSFNREAGSSNFFGQFSVPNRGSLSRTFAGNTGGLGLESSRTFSNHEQGQNIIASKIDNLRKYIRDLSSHKGKSEAKPAFDANYNQSASSTRLQADVGRIGGITDNKKNFLRTAGLSRDYSNSLDQSNIMNQSRDMRPPRSYQDFQSPPGGLAALEKKAFSPQKNMGGKFSLFDSSKKGESVRNITKTPQQKIRDDINNIFNSNSKASVPLEQRILSDKKKDAMKNSFTSGRLVFDERKETESNRLQDSNIFGRSTSKRENLQSVLNSSSTAFDSRNAAVTSNSFSGSGAAGARGKLRGDQKKYSVDEIIKLQDFLVDTHEQEFNSFSNELIEELLKLSSIIMFRVKNSNYYKNKTN